MKDFKYILAYISPLTAFVSVYLGGIWSFFTLFFLFVILPVSESILPASDTNFTPEEEEKKNVNVFFDLLLYLNLPILFALLWFFFSRLSAGGLETYEIVGMTIGVGNIVGSIGINVAHELGHRSNKMEQWMSKMMLMSSLYMHFFIEHNRGHHKNVATDEDPASSRLGENVYAFWVRSVTGSYMGAWNLENNRLKKQGKPVLSIENEMIHYHFIQLGYLVAIGLLFGWAIVPFAIMVAVSGFLQLETVNYIEHYGLRREKLENGRYEHVAPHHSWNSDYEMGRIFLYELTRHSDHHYKASRKYQVLRHFKESPQLPVGYPASMIMALAPPIWFKVMDSRVKSLRGELSYQTG